MPLVRAGLKSDLEDIADDPPDGHPAAAQPWADAVESYAGSIVPASSTVAAAAATLKAALAAAFATTNAAAAMETAFAAFAVTVGGGMTGFTPTPPAGAVGFAAQFSGPKPADHATAADQVSTLIDVWLKTGTAQLIAPPHTVSNWA
jgi:hypothetical protein